MRKNARNNGHFTTLLRERKKNDHERTKIQAHKFVPRVLAELLEGKLAALGDRIGRLLFKLAVNDGMLTYLAALDLDMDQPELDKLRVQCVSDAKHTHGIIELSDALASMREE